MISVSGFSRGITYAKDNRFQLEDRETRDGTKQIVVWFGLKRIAVFDVPSEKDNWRAFQDTCNNAGNFVDDCVRYGYTDNEKLQGLEKDALLDFFSRLRTYEDEINTHLREAGDFFRIIQSYHENLGLNFEDYDKMQKTFAEED